MKKLTAILLALTLCLTAFAALAEEAAEIPEVTVEATYEGTEVAIGDTGVSISIPTDWTVAEVPEGYYMCYVNADQTMGISAQLGQSLDACWEAAATMVEEGTAIELQEAYINGVYYMLYSTADNLYNFAYLPLNDDNCLVICFSVTSADVDGSIATQILGTATMAE